MSRSTSILAAWRARGDEAEVLGRRVFFVDSHCDSQTAGQDVGLFEQEAADVWARQLLTFVSEVDANGVAAVEQRPGRARRPGMASANIAGIREAR